MSLNYYRDKAGLSQESLAELSGLSQQQISHLETGRRLGDKQALRDCRSIVAALNSAGVPCTLDEVFPPTVVGGDSNFAPASANAPRLNETRRQPPVAAASAGGHR